MAPGAVAFTRSCHSPVESTPNPRTGTRGPAGGRADGAQSAAGTVSLTPVGRAQEPQGSSPDPGSPRAAVSAASDTVVAGHALAQAEEDPLSRGASAVPAASASPRHLCRREAALTESPGLTSWCGILSSRPQQMGRWAAGSRACAVGGARSSHILPRPPGICRPTKVYFYSIALKCPRKPIRLLPRTGACESAFPPWVCHYGHRDQSQPDGAAVSGPQGRGQTPGDLLATPETLVPTSPWKELSQAQKVTEQRASSHPRACGPCWCPRTQWKCGLFLPAAQTYRGRPAHSPTPWSCPFPDSLCPGGTWAQPQAGAAGVPWTSTGGLKPGLWESCEGGERRRREAFPVWSHRSPRAQLCPPFCRSGMEEVG